MLNKTPNDNLAKLAVKPISLAAAKPLTVENHYMRTWPQGAKLAFGVFCGARVVGVLVFGYSASTESKVRKYVGGLGRAEYIEMLRMWIADSQGHNTESFVLASAMRQLKQIGIRLVVTHAGGCKNDAGFVYQASAWLYFGAQKSNDFYLTEGGEYKNIAGALRFGRAEQTGTRQQIGEQLFGAGQLLETVRHLYFYPIDKGIRRRLAKIAKPFPKNSENFRYNQQWLEQGG